jgi:sugar lactone lactonase YvrE
MPQKPCTRRSVLRAGALGAIGLTFPHGGDAARSDDGSAAASLEAVTRELIGWGWEGRPHGQSLASDVLGQLAEDDPARPHFGSSGPYGGANRRGFSFFAPNSGRPQVPAGLAAHVGARLLAVPDYWNHRVLLFPLNADGSLAAREATGLLGQRRYDEGELGQGRDRLHYPTACAFDPKGQWLFVCDEYNHRILQFRVAKLDRPVRVFGQADFDAWGPDASPGRRVWDSTREVTWERRPGPVGFFLPRGVACDGNRLFVADCDNHRILVFTLAGATENGPRAPAVLGQADFTGNQPSRGEATGSATLFFPAGLALDRTARWLLVADMGNERLLVFDVAERPANGAAAVAVVPLRERAQPRPPAPAVEKRISGVTGVAVDAGGHVFVADREGRRVLLYHLDEIVAGAPRPRAALGKFEMSTDLRQTKPGNGGPTGLACAGPFVYVMEPRGNRVLCFDTREPERRAVNLLGQFHGANIRRPNYNKYGANDGADPYGLDLGDGRPALAITRDGQWLLVADTIGGWLLFFALGPDGLPLDRGARYALGVPDLLSRGNSYGGDRFNRPGHAVLDERGRLFVSDFQGSRLLCFDLSALMASTGPRALQPFRPAGQDERRPPDARSPWSGPPPARAAFEVEGIACGMPAVAVLGQADFWTGLRDTASERQLGKEICGLAIDRKRQRLIVGEKMNHRVVIFDISGAVATFMPARYVLGQADFIANQPFRGDKWHPRGLAYPDSLAYDSVTGLLFVCHGESSREREIVAFDLSGDAIRDPEPVLRIGGPRATVQADLPYVSRFLALDEKRRWLWCGTYALDLAGDFRRAMKVVGWFGIGRHANAESLQTGHGGKVADLLGYAVPWCHRFDTTPDALAVHPQTGTLYVADNNRFRVLAFQPEFRFAKEPLEVNVGRPAIGICGSGGLAPLHFIVTSGQLPSGVALDPDTGILRGTPTGPTGEYRVGIEVRTAVGRVTGERVVRVR